MTIAHEKQMQFIENLKKKDFQRQKKNSKTILKA